MYHDFSRQRKKCSLFTHVRPPVVVLDVRVQVHVLPGRHERVVRVRVCQVEEQGAAILGVAGGDVRADDAVRVVVKVSLEEQAKKRTIVLLTTNAMHWHIRAQCIPPPLRRRKENCSRLKGGSSPVRLPAARKCSP